MLPESTTTIGDGEEVATERPFQSMNAVERTKAKLRSWVNSWRGAPSPRAESMSAVIEDFDVIVLQA